MIALVRRGSGQGVRCRPLRWTVLAAASVVGIAVVALAWWLGPGLFTTSQSAEEEVVTASVAEPVPCTNTRAVETVRLRSEGEPTEARLSGCGHREGETLRVAVPSDPDKDRPQVRLADTVTGHSDLRRPVGLALVALSCFSGGIYAFLLGRRRRSSTAFA